MKYSEDTDDRRKANIDYVNQRWTQLYGWEKETGTEGIKYLFLVNSGAAVAVLAFHGSVEAVRAMVWPKVMLGLFVFGLILIGFLHLFRYFSAYRLFANWRGLVNEYFTDAKDWNTTVAEDIKKSARFRSIDWIAYASFACFIAGAGVGMLNFSSLNGESNVRKEAVTAPAKTGSTGKASDPTSGTTH